MMVIISKTPFKLKWRMYGDDRLTRLVYTYTIYVCVYVGMRLCASASSRNEGGLDVFVWQTNVKRSLPGLERDMP